MLTRLLGTVLLVGSCFQAPCQPAAPAQQVPRNVIYEALFRRVLFMEDVAKKLESEGKSGSAARSSVQKSLGLTDQEANVLKAVAKAWQVQLIANQNAATPIIQAARVEAKQLSAPSAGVLQQLQDLQGERDRLDANNIAQLGAALGPARFPQVDALVIATSTVRRLSVAQQVSR